MQLLKTGRFSQDVTITFPPELRFTPMGTGVLSFYAELTPGDISTQHSIEYDCDVTDDRKLTEFIESLPAGTTARVVGEWKIWTGRVLPDDQPRKACNWIKATEVYPA